VIWDNGVEDVGFGEFRLLDAVDELLFVSLDGFSDSVKRGGSDAAFEVLVATEYFVWGRQLLLFSTSHGAIPYVVWVTRRGEGAGREQGELHPLTGFFRIEALTV
jgi:hypothetical protein